MTSKRREDMVDLEQQFILRLPLTAADNLKKDLQIGGMSLKDKLSLEIHPETRRGKVVYDSQMYNAKLVDLPCIVESYKTTDRKTFYKCADISQMLMCKNDFADDSPDEDNNINSNSNVDSSTKKKEKDKRFLWNHGLCPPLKNVRKRRFRRTLQKKHPEQPDIERELRRLFSMDAQAIDVKWEIIYEQEKPDNGPHHTNISSNTHIPNSSKANKHNNNNNNNAGSSGGNRNKNSDGNINNNKKKSKIGGKIFKSENDVKDECDDDDDKNNKDNDDDNGYNNNNNNNNNNYLMNTENSNSNIGLDSNNNNNNCNKYNGDGDDNDNKSMMMMMTEEESNDNSRMMFADSDIFGEVSSSDSDEDDDVTFKSNDNKEGGEFKPSNQNEDSSLIRQDSTNQLSDGEIPSDNVQLIRRLNELKEKSLKCKEERIFKEGLLLDENTENHLKEGLLDEIQDLTLKESDLEKEISILQSMTEE